MNAIFSPDAATAAMQNRQPAVLRFLGHLFSFIFHPLFIPTYITAFLLFVHPSAFVGFNDQQKALKLTSIFVSSAFFPAFTVFLLKQLRFVESIFLKTQKDRIIPIIASMIFYFWIFYVRRNQQQDPPQIKALLLGVFLSSIAALMANIYFKVSLHAIAMGGLFIYFILLSLMGDAIPGLYLSIAVFIAGAVCTARLLISDHHPFEVYAGFLFGMICQAVAIGITG